MNYLQPRQLEKSKKWHFTSRNGDRVWAIGYCAEHEPHETREEAVACYGRYLLDHMREWDAASAEKCIECGEWTPHIVEVGCEIFHICKTHDVRSVVERRFVPPEMIWSS
jgi:hypothetical protein